jgi:muconolactone delta-isomerase
MLLVRVTTPVPLGVWRRLRACQLMDDLNYQRWVMRRVKVALAADQRERAPVKSAARGVERRKRRFAGPTRQLTARFDPDEFRELRARLGRQPLRQWLLGEITHYTKSHEDDMTMEALLPRQIRHIVRQFLPVSRKESQLVVDVLLDWPTSVVRRAVGSDRWRCAELIRAGDAELLDEALQVASATIELRKRRKRFEQKLRSRLLQRPPTD